MHIVIYVAPISIKFWWAVVWIYHDLFYWERLNSHDPLYGTFLLLGIMSIFKPYPTLADSGLFISLVALFPEIYSRRCSVLSKVFDVHTLFLDLRHPIVTALLHLHACLLLPLFENLWLVQGTGNANFFYASTLVFGMANGAAVIDCMFAGLRIAFPDKKGYDIVQE